MIRFSLFGIPIRIEPFFWVIMALIGGALRADTKEGIALTSMFVVAGFISITIHELGHALTMRKYGANAEIVLHGMGGLAIPDRGFTRRQSFLVTAAGPVLQIIFGLAVWVVAKDVGIPHPYLAAFVTFFVWISIVWALLNLVPVLPLDGGHIMASILGPERVRETLIISIIAAVVCAIFVYQRFNAPIFAVFLLFFGYRSYQDLKRL